ncbi:MAG: histidine phosphatase family protein [Pleurocapsa sp.]
MNYLISNEATFSTSSTQVILVRHARSNYNEQGRYQGSSDDSILTEKGHRDAFVTGLSLKEYNFDAIYTSPLTRVQQTTQEIFSSLKENNNSPPIFIDPLLTEINMSNWHGLYYQEVKEKFPDDYKSWQETPHLFTFNDTFYPVLELCDRARQFWQKVLTKHRGATILVVAHGGTNRALISTAIDLQPQAYHTLQQSNCGISCLEFPSDHNCGWLKYLNCTEHLGETLPKLKAGKTGWRWLLLANDNYQNSTNYSYLTKLINSNYIDLIVTDNSQLSESLANQFSIPNTIMPLSISQNYCFDNWQHKLLLTSQKHSLTSILIIASNELLTKILSKNLNISIVNLIDCLTVIHYPQFYNHVILQGLLPLRKLKNNKCQ